MDSYQKGRRARIKDQPKPTSHKGHNEDYLRGWLDQDRVIKDNSPPKTKEEWKEYDRDLFPR